MRLINNILYIEFQEMVECGVDENTLSKAKQREANCWVFIDDPKDKRRVLVDFEEMKQAYKDMVERRYGNPYEHVARGPILAMVTHSVAAHDFYMQYRYQVPAKLPGRMEEKPLPVRTVNQYTRGAAWLDLIGRVLGDKKLVKAELGLSTAEFYANAAKLIDLEKNRGKMKDYLGMDMVPGDFPSSYQRLMDRARRYQEEGFESLVAPEYGNKSAAKIGKIANLRAGAESGERVASERSEWVAPPQPSLPTKVGTGTGREVASERSGNVTLTMSTAMGLTPGNVGKVQENDPKSNNKGGGFDPELAEKQLAVIRACCRVHMNWNAAQVAETVNVMFLANGWLPVSAETVRKIIQANQAVLTPGRKGKKAYENTIAMQVKRKAPEMPLSYWTLDGWTVELMYQEKSGSGERGAKGTQFKRLVVVVVLDAFTNYPIGYAIGERETPELIREANRNALLHVRDLFGQVYRPVQLQSDNYQIKNLTPFYNAVSHLHTPAAVGNAKAKRIEPYFKYLNNNYCQKLANWTGHNVTASKKRQVNVEMLDKIKNMFPDRQGVEKQIQTIMAMERELKRDRYVSGWDKLPADRRYTMDVEQWLGVFGLPVGNTNRITGEGLVKQINGVKYVYDSFEPGFRAQMHLDWQIYADPTDLSKVLAVAPDGLQRFVLEHKHVVAMDLLSSTPEDHQYLSKVKAFNKNKRNEIIELTGHDAEVMRDVLEHTGVMEVSGAAELALKTMLTMKGQQKEGIQDAKGLRQNSNEEIPNSKAARREIAVAREEWDTIQNQRMESQFDFSIFQ